MEYRPQMNIGGLLLGILFACVFLTIWIGYWFVAWPPPRLGWGAALVGMCIGIVFCVDRLLHWDVHQWQWRNPKRTERYQNSIWLPLVPYGGILGMLSLPFLEGFFGEYFNAMLFPFAGSVIGLIFLWGSIEGALHLWYRRQQNR